MSKKYIPGTYSAEAEGMSKIKVDLTVDQEKITDVKIDTPGESKKFGQAANDELRQQILDVQSADIDGVTGASLTTKAVKTATTEALEKASGQSHQLNLSLKDGNYQASALGHGGPLTVELTARNNQIKDLKVISETETPDVATYAIKEIPKQIVNQQTLAVDAVTGATLTSKAILTAAQDAIEKAGGDSTSWLKQKYQNPLDYHPEDLHTDVVIMGAGISGLAAGLFLTEKGKKVIILEKNSQVGGSFRYSAGGYALANTKKIHNMGYDDSIQTIMKYVHDLNDNRTSNPIDEEFVQYLLDKTGLTFDKMVDLLNVSIEVQPEFDFAPYLHAVFGGANGAHEADMMKKYIENHGGQILVNTSVKDWLKDDDVINGLIATHNGQNFNVFANQVIIASGGTSYNHDKMMNQVTPSVKNVDIFNEANVGNTGDGFDLLVKAGAVKDNHDVYKNGFLDFAPQFYITWQNVPSTQKSVIINASGKRFTNEELSDCIATEMFKDGSPAYYAIMDDQTIDPALKAKMTEINENAKTYVTANNVVELANKINVDEKTLEKTVAEYNEAADQGNDPLGKQAQFLTPITGEDKYYAVYVMPGTWGTMGGVKINQKMQPLKNDGSHFDNVYAIGEVSTGDLFSEYYMGGFSLAYYSTEGRLVAEEIAN